MSDTSYTSGGEEDLPRTVRQQKEARARDQQARDNRGGSRTTYNQTAALAAAARGTGSTSLGGHLDGDPRGSEFPLAQSPPGEYPLTTVTRLQIPFTHMVVFFLKAVLAAIPALILLTLILWGGGQLAKHYMPWLVQMKIDITFPR